MVLKTIARKGLRGRTLQPHYFKGEYMSKPVSLPIIINLVVEYCKYYELSNQDVCGILKQISNNVCDKIGIGDN
jgi:hypothetical protein